MPLYNSNVTTNTPMTALYPGDSFLLFNGETPIAGQNSQQVVIARKDLDTPSSVSVELIFPADPGAFEFDICDADTDTPDAYLVLPAIGQILAAVAGVGGKFVVRVESVPIKANFLLLRCVTASANGKSVIAKVSR